MDKLDWSNLLEKGANERLVEAWLSNANIENDISNGTYSLDVIKDKLFGCLQIYVKNREIVCLSLQLLQNITKLINRGIAIDELKENIDAIKSAIQGWITETDVSAASFRFLSSVPEYYAVIGGDDSLFDLITEALNSHLHSKKVQQPALEILKIFLRSCNVNDTTGKSQERVTAIASHVLTAFQQLPKEVAVIVAGCKTLNFAITNFGPFITEEQRRTAVGSISRAFVLYGADAEFLIPAVLVIDRMAEDGQGIPTFITSAKTFTDLANFWGLRTGAVKAQLAALRLIYRGLTNATVGSQALADVGEKHRTLGALYSTLKANQVFDGDLITRLGISPEEAEAEHVYELISDLHTALGATSPLPEKDRPNGDDENISDLTSPTKPSLEDRVKSFIANSSQKNPNNRTPSTPTSDGDNTVSSSKAAESLSAKMARLTKTPLPKGPAATTGTNTSIPSLPLTALEQTDTRDSKGNEADPGNQSTSSGGPETVTETVTETEQAADLVDVNCTMGIVEEEDDDEGDDALPQDKDKNQQGDDHHKDDADDDDAGEANNDDGKSPSIDGIGSPQSSSPLKSGTAGPGTVSYSPPSPLKMGLAGSGTVGHSPSRRRSPFAVVAGGGSSSVGSGEVGSYQDSSEEGNNAYNAGGSSYNPASPTPNSLGFHRSPFASSSSGSGSGSGSGSSAATRGTPKRGPSSAVGTSRKGGGSLSSSTAGFSPGGNSKGNKHQQGSSKPLSREGSAAGGSTAEEEQEEGEEEEDSGTSTGIDLIRKLRAQIKELTFVNQEKQRKLDEAKDLIEIARISQKQAAVAIDRADTMNKLFNDAVAKVEALTMENDVLKAELNLLKYAPEEYHKKYDGSGAFQGHVRMDIYGTEDQQQTFADDTNSANDADALTTDAPTDVSLAGDLESDWRDGFSTTDCGLDSVSNNANNYRGQDRDLGVDPETSSSNKFAALYNDHPYHNNGAAAPRGAPVTPTKASSKRKDDFDIKSTSSISTGMISVPSPAKGFRHGGRLILAVKGIRSGIASVQAKLDSELAVKNTFLPPHELLFGATAAALAAAATASASKEKKEALAVLEAEGGDEIENAIQDLALLAMRLFLSVKARGVGVSTDKARQSTITLVILRSLLKNWGLVDGKRLRLCDVDIVFSQLGMPSVCVQEFTYILVVCGHKRFRKWPAKELLTRLNQLLEANAPAEFARNVPTLMDPIKALEQVAKLSQVEISAIVKYLDTEKRALEAIFDNYVDAPRYTPLSNGNGIGTVLVPSGAMNMTSATAVVTTSDVVTMKGASKMMWVGMSFEGVQQFAKEFELCPQGLAVVQLSEMFWNHVMGGSAIMWDQEDAGGVLAAKVHAVSITGKNGEPLLNFKGFQSFLVVMALRCACFRSAHHHKKPISRFASVERVNNLMIWLASYGGMARIASRHRSSTVVGFRTHQLSAAAAAASAVSGHDVGHPI